MTELTHVHHINFLVTDLDEAVRKYEAMLGLKPFKYEELQSRGVRTARSQVGDTWIVLVSPQHMDSEAARCLEQHGEGFFLLSFGVDDIDQAMTEFAKRGSLDKSRAPRPGLSNWQVSDLDTVDRLGIRFHLTQDR